MWSRVSLIFVRLLGIIFCLMLFVLALMMMKDGAGPLEPWIRGHFSVDTPASALGFGWLGSSLALSGSPVAATALSLLDAEVLNGAEAFAMIAGSRLGASFLLLIIGFIYIIRGQQQRLSMGVGLVSLLVTQTIYPAVLLIGYILLGLSWLKPSYVTEREANALFDLVIEPLLLVLRAHIPPLGMLIVGFLLVLVTLWAFDRLIPAIRLKETDLGLVARVLYRPIIVFLLGAFVTTLTMSVSVSLGLLVPLSVRGYIRQENLIPYILGANITTFVDTLIAAALLNNPVAVTIVFVQMISVLTVTLVILVTSLRFYERVIHYMANWIAGDRLLLLIYILLILGIPIALLWIG